MPFELTDRWVWDSWIADDGDNYHLFYLNAPRSLQNPDLRHRNATIGHAVSVDLRNWTDLGATLERGQPGDFDETATWTGCVVHDGQRWRLYYTGSVFLDPKAHTNIETIGEAVSDDLQAWQKSAGPLLKADKKWYETLQDGTWPEEAWRDPWVYKEADGWHMLITARSRPLQGINQDVRDSGVVGHAVSTDLLSWEAREPLSAPGSGFGHLEVLQPFSLGGRDYVLFSCDRLSLAGRRSDARTGGVWVAPRDSSTGWCSIEQARLLVDESIYAARVVQERDGGMALIGFENDTERGFQGRVSDPLPLAIDNEGWPCVNAQGALTH